MSRAPHAFRQSDLNKWMTAKDRMEEDQSKVLESWQRTLADRQRRLDEDRAAHVARVKLDLAQLASRRQELANRERVFREMKKAAMAANAEPFQPRALEQKHLGSRSELIACAWLLERGCEVFRNVSCHGLVDIIAIQGTNVFLFDVKTTRNPEADIPHRLSEEQIALGVIPLLVEPDGSCRIDRGESVATVDEPQEIIP